MVESDTAPRTRAGVNGLFVPLPGNETEPLGQRIVEVPENPEFTERLRSPRSGFVAYVPVGSIARGEVIVTKGGETLLVQGYELADMEHGVFNTPQTKFRIGSMTKQFTAMAIVILQEQGNSA